MCGIVGFIGPTAGKLHNVQRMASVLSHRGPDDDGFFVAPGIELGMRRLAVIDIAHGQQPVSAVHGSVQVVFNGEIYNFRDLRSQLAQRGHAFTTDSDTEVIAVGYAEYGVNIASLLDGMFAIAIWDGRIKELVLIRDRLGKKPLLYTVADSGDIMFASEARAILQAGWVPEANLAAVDSVLALGYTPVHESAFAGIKNVPPAHILRWRSGSISTQRYWAPRLETRHSWTYEEAKQRVLAEIDRAVQVRLLSERPLGAFLSGGYDSSLVTALMARNHGERVKTFTVAFDDPRYDESGHAQRVADFLGTDHHTLRVEPDPVLLSNMITKVFDQPFADSSAIPSFLLSQFARSEVVVALGGDGGDEVFGGYERYRIAPLLQRMNPMLRVIEPVDGLLSQLADRTGHRRLGRLTRTLQSFPSLATRYVGLMTLTGAAERRQLWLPDVAEHLVNSHPENSLLDAWRECGAQNDYDHMIGTDIATYLPGDLLVKADIASMANSLELRSPLLDHRVVELGLSLPVSMRVSPRGTKLILKEIARDLIPSAILDRPKMGFGIPRASWLRGPLRELVRDTLSPSAVDKRGWFSSAQLERILDDHDRGSDRDNIIWPLLMIELWAQTWLDTHRPG